MTTTAKLKIAERTISFFIDNFPSSGEILIGGPPSLLWAFLCLYFAGSLKRRKELRTGYTRKIFHFSIFFTVVMIQWVWGTPAVCLFGGMTTLVIFFALWRGDGHILYEAMAREKDAPHRTYYIIIPYIATLLGGLASNILFGPVAIVGYLVTGWGDAVGEPIGTKFGKHTYTVPSLSAVKAVRSLEGSAAVFLMSLIAIVLSVLLSSQFTFESAYIGWIPLLAFICTLIEAVSPHGWDNATMQILPTLLATHML